MRENIALMDEIVDTRARVEVLSSQHGEAASRMERAERANGTPVGAKRVALRVVTFEQATIIQKLPQKSRFCPKIYCRSRHFLAVQARCARCSPGVTTSSRRSTCERRAPPSPPRRVARVSAAHGQRLVLRPHALSGQHRSTMHNMRARNVCQAPRALASLSARRSSTGWASGAALRRLTSRFRGSFLSFRTGPRGTATPPSERPSAPSERATTRSSVYVRCPFCI